MSNKTKFYKVDVNEINIYSKLARVLNRKFDTNKLEVFHVVYDESGFKIEKSKYCIKDINYLSVYDKNKSFYRN